MCLKISVISFSVKSLITVDASLLDQGFCMSERSAYMFLGEVCGHLHELFLIFFFCILSWKLYCIRIQFITYILLQCENICNH